jgi:hypothetical protein
MRNGVVVLIILFNFALGIYAGFFLKSFYDNEFEVKTELPQENEEENVELKAPHNWIREENIGVYADKIVIDLADLEGRKTSWATYANTGSMLPTFGQGCNGLEFIPSSPADIHVGDLVAFKRDDSLVIHRVVKTGIDNYGWFAFTKGDNNRFVDERLSFDMISFVTFALVC